jgi:hypothetical protein
MNFIETETGELINLNNVVLVETKDNRYYVYVHLFLDEFRKYEISELTMYKIKNRFQL